MSISTNVGGVWKEGTPSKVNVGGVWKTVSAAKVNVGGVWKDVFTSGPPAETEPPYITEVRAKPTGNPYEMELTAWGGIGPEFSWRCKPFETTSTRGPKVIIKTFPKEGDYDVSCQDMNLEAAFFVENRVTVPKYVAPTTSGT
jgi:hypothetical protein